MTYSGKTLLLFGIYLLCISLVLILVPNFLLNLFAIPDTLEVWVRVTGMLLFYFGVFDVAAARGGWTGYIKLSVPMRLSVVGFIAAFVLLVDAPVMLLLFGVTDFVFALWTWGALRKESRGEGEGEGGE